MKAQYLNVFFAGKKGNKRGDLNDTMKLLVSSIGGEKALARESPICAGRYNSTKAKDVSSMLIWVNYCNMISFFAGRKTAVEHFQV